MRNFSRLCTVGALRSLFALGVPATGVNATTVKPLVLDLASPGRGMNQIIGGKHLGCRLAGGIDRAGAHHRGRRDAYRAR